MLSLEEASMSVEELEAHNPSTVPFVAANLTGTLVTVNFSLYSTGKVPHRHGDSN